MKDNRKYIKMLDKLQDLTDNKIACFQICEEKEFELFKFEGEQIWDGAGGYKTIYTLKVNRDLNPQNLKHEELILCELEKHGLIQQKQELEIG